MSILLYVILSAAKGFLLKGLLFSFFISLLLLFSFFFFVYILCGLIIIFGTLILFFG